MSAATIAGYACSEGDVGAQYHRSGAVRSCESFDTMIEDLDDDGVAIDTEHDHQAVGVVTHAEIDTAGKLGVVGVIADGEWLLDFPHPVFYSPELLVIGEGVRTRAVSIASHAALLGVSLVTNPATIGAHPIHIMPGDMRSTPDRWQWPLSWRGDHPLVARAVDHLPPGFKAEHHRARSIHREQVIPAGAGPLLRRDAGYADEHGRLHGKDWWHGAPGRILSVEGYAVPPR